MPTQAIEDTIEISVNRVPLALKAIQTYYGLTNAEIGQLVDRPTNWVQERTSGKRSCKVEDLFRFATGLHVPAELLIQERDDVLRWLIDNGDAALLGEHSGWRFTRSEDREPELVIAGS